jgi:glycine/D-amino acid oxidase-like deaminating enzyme
VELYRESAVADAGFELPSSPTGLMLISFDEEAVRAAHSALTKDWPDLRPELLAAGEAVRVEPSLHPELAACRLETGYPVAPATATLAFARRAQAAGAAVFTATEASISIVGERTAGIRIDGRGLECDKVLVAAGPWTSDLVPGWAALRPIGAVWGVVATTTISESPVHILEELGIGHEAEMSGRLFSLVTVGGAASVGSTFIEEVPDEHALAAEIVARGAMFVPALASAQIESIRSCARPASFDGRPIIGAVPAVDGLYVCAGHGPWGISTGPASAELIVQQIRGEASEWPELSAARMGKRVAPENVAPNTEFA